MRLHPGAREEVLLKLMLPERGQPELAVLGRNDSGKPVSVCDAIEVPGTIHCLK